MKPTSKTWPGPKNWRFSFAQEVGMDPGGCVEGGVVLRPAAVSCRLGELWALRWWMVVVRGAVVLRRLGGIYSFVGRQGGYRAPPRHLTRHPGCQSRADPTKRVVSWAFDRVWTAVMRDVAGRVLLTTCQGWGDISFFSLSFQPCLCCQKEYICIKK
jgi:hypothetical protein